LEHLEHFKLLSHLKIRLEYDRIVYSNDIIITYPLYTMNLAWRALVEHLSRGRWICKECNLQWKGVEIARKGKCKERPQNSHPMWICKEWNLQGWCDVCAV